MLLTLRCLPGEMPDAFKSNGRNFPEAVLHLFANIFDEHFAQDGEGHLEEAMWYEWPEIEGAESPYFLNKEKWTAVIFGPPDYLGYADLDGLFVGKRPYLSIQPVFEDEFEIVKRFGAARVMALFGQVLQAYPWPRHVDRTRTSVIPANVDPNKALTESKVFDAGEQVLLSDLCAVLDVEKRSISVRLPQHQVALLKEHIDSLPPASGFIFNLTFAPHADTHLYWNTMQKGSDKFSTIKRPRPEGEEAPKENLIGGSFLAFVPRGATDLITVHEDGFVAMISSISWGVLRQCLSNGLNCKIASDLPAGYELDISFADDDIPDDEEVDEAQEPAEE